MRETMSVTGINSLDPHVIPRTLKRILPPNWCVVRNLAQWIAVCFSLRHHVLISLDDNSSTGDTSNRLPIRTVALSRGVLASVLSIWHKLKLFGKKITSNEKMSPPHIDWQACETFSWLMIDMVCILPTHFLMS